MGLVCANCSADNEGTARFCRKCGARIFNDEVHEASTRNLPPEQLASDANGQPRTTGRIDRLETGPPPAGYDPSPHYVPPAPLTPSYPPGAPVQAKKRNWAMILLATFASLTLLCGLGGFFIYSAVKRAAQDAGVKFDKNRVEVKDPSTGKTARFGNVDPSELTPEQREWYFPGSQIVMFAGVDEGALSMIMQSDADLDEISAFYKKKMGPDADISDIREGGGERTLAMSKDSNNVTVANEGGGATKQIIVSLGDGAEEEEEFVEEEGPEIPEVPEPPEVNVPTPPIPPPPPPAKAPRAPGT